MFNPRTWAMGIVFPPLCRCHQVYTGKVRRVSLAVAGRCGGETARSLDRVTQIAPTWPTESGSYTVASPDIPTITKYGRTPRASFDAPCSGAVLAAPRAWAGAN